MARLRWGRRGWIVSGAVAVLVVVTGVTLLPGASSGTDGGEAPAPASATARVERRDLVRTETLAGTLGFGESRAIAARRSGVLTSTAGAGETVREGAALFAIDLAPTVLLTGAVPAYRQLDAGASDGPDVRQLEEALVRLGFGAGLTVDDDFTGATGDAVRDWEKALGRADPDETIELGEVVFAGSALRVGDAAADIGSPVKDGTTVLRATSPDRVVTVNLDADRTDLLPVGAAVTVTLPNGGTTAGRVAGVGEPTKPATGAQNTETTVPVTITLNEPAAASGFDTGAVDVVVERGRADQVLAVPVPALLALAEGGYAVEVADPAGRRLVAVKVGSFAGSLVEITGINEGVEVVVPK